MIKHCYGGGIGLLIVCQSCSVLIWLQRFIEQRGPWYVVSQESRTFPSFPQQRRLHDGQRARDGDKLKIDHSVTLNDPGEPIKNCAMGSTRVLRRWRGVGGPGPAV